MNIVPDLFSFVAENRVFSSFNIGFDQITQKPVQFNSGVIRARQAASTQAAGAHSKIPAVFLDEDVGGHFRGAKQRMQRLIDREGFGDSARVRGFIVLPARWRLTQPNSIWPITVDLVGGKMN